MLIQTVSNFAWGAMLRQANSLFPACCCARPIPRWYFAAICTCSQVGIVNIFQLKQLKHGFEVGLLHEASEVILLLSKTALYTWWAHHRVISSHIESYRANHVCFLHVFFGPVTLDALECRQFHGHGVARACSVGNSAASRAEEGKVRTGLFVSTQGT